MLSVVHDTLIECNFRTTVSVDLLVDVVDAWLSGTYLCHKHWEVVTAKNRMIHVVLCVSKIRSFLCQEQLTVTSVVCEMQLFFLYFFL